MDFANDLENRQINYFASAYQSFRESISLLLAKASCLFAWFLKRKSREIEDIKRNEEKIKEKILDTTNGQNNLSSINLLNSSFQRFQIGGPLLANNEDVIKNDSMHPELEMNIFFKTMILKTYEFLKNENACVKGFEYLEKILPNLKIFIFDYCFRDFFFMVEEKFRHKLLIVYECKGDLALVILRNLIKDRISTFKIRNIYELNELVSIEAFKSLTNKKTWEIHQKLIKIIEKINLKISKNNYEIFKSNLKINIKNFYSMLDKDLAKYVEENYLAIPENQQPQSQDFFNFEKEVFSESLIKFRELTFAYFNDEILYPLIQMNYFFYIDLLKLKFDDYYNQINEKKNREDFENLRSNRPICNYTYYKNLSIIMAKTNDNKLVAELLRENAPCSLFCIQAISTYLDIEIKVKLESHLITYLPSNNNSNPINSITIYHFPETDGLGHFSPCENEHDNFHYDNNCLFRAVLMNYHIPLTPQRLRIIVANIIELGLDTELQKFIENNWNLYEIYQGFYGSGKNLKKPVIPIEKPAIPIKIRISNPSFINLNNRNLYEKKLNSKWLEEARDLINNFIVKMSITEDFEISCKANGEKTIVGSKNLRIDSQKSDNQSKRDNYQLQINRTISRSSVCGILIDKPTEPNIYLISKKKIFYAFKKALQDEDMIYIEIDEN